MSSGHGEDTTRWLYGREDGDWVKGFLHAPVDYAPGTHFVYNNGASYVLSALVTKVAGVSLLEYLLPRLFTPIGITAPSWEANPDGISAGGWGLCLPVEDLAKFGLLYLQNGIWNGTSLLPPDWVSEASARQIANGDDPRSDWNQGYGYQFWRCRHGAYRASGAFGQICLILPEQEVVLAVTGGTAQEKTILNAVWTHLLPALSSRPLPSDPEGQVRLRERLMRLAHRPPDGSLRSPIASSLSEVLYQLDDNRLGIRTLVLHFDEEGRLLVDLENQFGEQRLAFGMGEWACGTTEFLHGHSSPVCAAAAWREERTLELAIRFTETPFCETLVCRFAPKEVSVTLSRNVGYHAKEETFRGRKQETAGNAPPAGLPPL
ncbi:serine hydrolase [Paenibacillus sp. CC-CFT747]|nr:serine hydrolase [Paenibacillus sp. CC-CFT747]